jgi:hypothetical protein
MPHRHLQTDVESKNEHIVLSHESMLEKSWFCSEEPSLTAIMHIA